MKVKKLIACILAMFISVGLLPIGASSTQVIQNGGFETGDFTGWDMWNSAVNPIDIFISTESNSGVYAAKGIIDTSCECGSMEQTFMVPHDAIFSFYYKSNMQASNVIYYGDYRVISGWSLYDMTTGTQFTQAYFDKTTDYTLASYDLSLYEGHVVKFRIYIGTDGKCGISMNYEVLIDDVGCISSGQPPVAEAGPDHIVYEGDIVNFDGSSSYDPDGSIVNYTWDFGNGASAYGVNVAHVYPFPGIYIVSLTVTDDDGAFSADTCLVTVLSSVPTATVDFDPDTLNLKSRGRWISVYLSFEEGIINVNIDSVILEDTIPAEWGNVRNDTLIVKFDRSEVEDMLSPGVYNLKVSGELMDGTLFEGYSDEIRVIEPP